MMPVYYMYLAKLIVRAILDDEISGNIVHHSE